MAFKSGALKTRDLLIGICLPSLKHNASRIAIKKFELDEKLLMFFKEKFTLYAYDPNKICKTGDVVLIKELSKKMSSTITHEVIEVVYPCGDVVDPVTGTLVTGTEYRDQIELVISTQGRSKNAFTYEKAPKRGWQEGKKDFTHRPRYIKYNEFDEGDECRDQPFSTTS